jgi:hypothetical protein
MTMTQARKEEGYTADMTQTLDRITKPQQLLPREGWVFPVC